MTLAVDLPRYVLFLGVITVLCWIPGPANLFSVANGAGRGRRGAIVGVMGMNAGTLVWFAGAALGLGAVVAKAPFVFKVLAWLGALYVAWLGVNALASAWRADGPPSDDFSRLGRSAFADGFLVQMTNPKALLFFTAVLPPFLDLHRPLAPQLLLFAGGVIVMDVIAMTTYGLGGAALSARMRHPHFRRVFLTVVGGVLLTVSVLIILRV